MKKLFVALGVCAGAFVACAGRTHSLDEFPRLAGETDDAPRFQRAIDASTCGLVKIPGGDYELARTVLVTNLCSIEIEPPAVIRAVAKMPWMIKIDASWQLWKKNVPAGVNAEMYNLTYRGGTLDAQGLASCLAIDNYAHFTLENATFLNGRKFGVGIETTGRGYEMIARNLYFKTVIPGLAGNTGLYTYGGDSHYTDIISVDYTTGVHLAGRGANRLTRVHVWGGPLKPVRPDGLREMLENSVCFRVDSSGEILRDCYADTGEIGFWINGSGVQMFGCRYFNNTGFKMKDVTVIRQDRGTLYTDGCVFQKNTSETCLYRGGPDAKIVWGDMNDYHTFAFRGAVAASSRRKPERVPYNIDVGRQLLLDDAILETNSARRIWNRPKPSVCLPAETLPRVGDWRMFYNPFTRYWEYVTVRDDGKGNGPRLWHTEDQMRADDPADLAGKVNTYAWIPKVSGCDFNGGAYEGFLIGFVKNPPGAKDAGAWRFGFSRDRWRWTFPAAAVAAPETTRPDGFCALADGVLRTRPLVFTAGDRLYLNADATQGGIGVYAQGLDGRRLGEATLSGIDAPRHAAFALKPDEPFRLRIDLSNGARLYSFWIAGPSGEPKSWDKWGRGK